jgi:hypothetical protein
MFPEMNCFHFRKYKCLMQVNLSLLVALLLNDKYKVRLDSFFNNGLI